MSTSFLSFLLSFPLSSSFPSLIFLLHHFLLPTENSLPNFAFAFLYFIFTYCGQPEQANLPPGPNSSPCGTLLLKPKKGTPPTLIYHPFSSPYTPFSRYSLTLLSRLSLTPGTNTTTTTTPDFFIFCKLFLFFLQAIGPLRTHTSMY